jgi:hypothetical protein
MTSTLKEAAYGSSVALFGNTELASLPNGQGTFGNGGGLSSNVFDNTSNLYVAADVVVQLGIVTPVSGGYIELAFLWSPDGSNFADPQYGSGQSASYVPLGGTPIWDSRLVSPTAKNWDSSYSTGFAISTTTETNDGASHSSAGTQSARTSFSVPSSKIYFEQVPGGLVNNSTGWGVCDSTHSASAGFGDGHSVQFLTALSITSGNRQGIALDGSAKKGWWRNNGGAWQGGSSPRPGRWYGGHRLLVAVGIALLAIRIIKHWREHQPENAERRMGRRSPKRLRRRLFVDGGRPRHTERQVATR